MPQSIEPQQSQPDVHVPPASWQQRFEAPSSAQRNVGGQQAEVAHNAPGNGAQLGNVGQVKFADRDVEARRTCVKKLIICARA